MSMEYNVFQTDWGFVGLVGSGNEVSSLILPLPAKDLVLRSLGQTREGKLAYNPVLFPRLTEQLQAYFAGYRVDEWACEPDLSLCSDFTRRVLLATALIPYGAVQTYGMLAQNAGCSRGSRAVGQALKRNPLPIIIPCHRVVAAGGLGGFSAPGGLETKKALLKLEGHGKN
ncbi:MAG: methylated-DNA--[protein]-cysteine S-methyltransferase [Bacillota bacterium]